jgi:hypothetical protein
MTRLTIHAIAGAACTIVLGGAMTSGTRAQENDVPIYAGVFSAEQAAGASRRSKPTARCAPISRAPSAARAEGRQLLVALGDETVATLFVKVRDNMPPNCRAELDRRPSSTSCRILNTGSRWDAAR